MDDRRTPKSQTPSPHDVDEDIPAIRLIALLGGAVVMAAALPPALAAPILCLVLISSAALIAFSGALIGERLSARRITRWDEAVVLVFTAVAVSGFGPPGGIVS